MKIEIKSCCFSGHRQLPLMRKKNIYDLLCRTVGQLSKNGCRTFISGGALGFDLMAAEAVLEAKKENKEIKLVMMLPCKDQHVKWSESDRIHYEEIISCADEVVYVCENYVTGCMHLRNKRMIDSADICVAYFENRRGGTEHTLSYAADKGCPVINVAQML